MRLIDYLEKPDTREFLAVFHEVNSTELKYYPFGMNDKWDLDENTCEFKISICEKVSAINELEVGQSIPFNPIRGEQTCNGFILRMK